MSDKPLQILDDDREIAAVYWHDDDCSAQIVGHNFITKIVAYGEPGQFCNLPWLAVYEGDKIVRRFAAGQVEIEYTLE